MHSFWNLLPASGWERLAADAAWQSTAIAAAALVAAGLVRRRAALRAAILFSAAVLALAVPLLSTAVRLGGGGLLARPAVGPWLAADEMIAASEVTTGDLTTSKITAPETTGLKITEPKTTGLETTVSAETHPLATHWAAGAWPWFVGCWLATSGYLAFRLVLGVFAVRRWIQTARPCRDRKIKAALARAARAVGVGQPELLWSKAFDSPALVVLGRARLLLPIEMPADVDWFTIFCHELAHRARRDNVSRLVVELAVTALPWQPLLWLARRGFRTACEEACDDWAVAAGADPIEFASLLVALVPERRPALALGMAESPSATRQRIVRLLAMTGAVRPRLGLALVAAGGLSAVALAVALALLQYNSGPRLFRNVPPWGDLPLDEAVAQAARGWVASVPTEKDKSTLPTYIIEPPDILMFEAIKTVPKSPYHIERGDTLDLEIADPHKTGQFVVDVDGELSLGPGYESIKVAGLTLPEARAALQRELAKTVQDPQFTLTLSFAPIQRQIEGEHLVSPDGSVTLGTYGTVSVAGLTLAEAKAAVEAQLSNYLENPRVSVDVFAYNSQVYYIITEGSGLGDTLVRVPITGNETFLDALAQVNGLSRLSSKNIWIARPTPGDVNRDQILPVSWTQIVAGAATTTNYQVLPGDRIFIQDKLSRYAPDEPEEETTEDAEDSPTAAAPIRRASESY